MTYLSKFHLDSLYIKLKTLDVLDELSKKEALEFLKKLYIDINHNIEESASYTFNLLNINTTLEFPSHFIDFLEMNLNLSKGYGGLFYSFLPQKLDLNALVEINNNKVTKLKNFVLDTSYLRTPYLVEGFSNYLTRELEFDNYLIEVGNNFVAKGKKEWVIAHASFPGMYGIVDEAILFTDYTIIEKNKNDIKPIKLMLSSDSPCINQIEYSIFPDLHNEEEYAKYAEDNNLKFLIIDSQLNYYQYPKN